MKENRWYTAITSALSIANGPLTVGQLVDAVVTDDFKHGSKDPRATLGGRLAELRKMGKVERVGPSTYQLKLKPETGHDASAWGHE